MDDRRRPQVRETRRHAVEQHSPDADLREGEAVDQLCPRAGLVRLHDDRGHSVPDHERAQLRQRRRIRQIAERLLDERLGPIVERHVEVSAGQAKVQSRTYLPEQAGADRSVGDGEHDRPRSQVPAVEVGREEPRSVEALAEQIGPASGKLGVDIGEEEHHRQEGEGPATHLRSSRLASHSAKATAQARKTYTQIRTGST
jgi:hypothetical protein